MDPRAQQLLAARNGLKSIDEVRHVLTEPTFSLKRSKQDKKLLDNISMGEIIDMPFGN